MWDLPGPGLELVSPALAGGFSTTAPPGKFLKFLSIRKGEKGEFLGCPAVRTWFFHCWGLGSILGQGTKTRKLRAAAKKKKKRGEWILEGN